MLQPYLIESLAAEHQLDLRALTLGGRHKARDRGAETREPATKPARALASRRGTGGQVLGLGETALVGELSLMWNGPVKSCRAELAEHL